MAIASNGSAVQLFYVREVAGAIPGTAPVFNPIRFVTEGLNRDVSEIPSAEINPKRQRPVSRQGTFSVTGTIASELSFGSFDDLIGAALQGAWVPRSTTSGTTISASSTDNSISDSGSGFVAAGFQVGDTVIVSGFTAGANNGRFVATTVTASKITFGGTDGDVIVTEAAGNAVTLDSNAASLKVGSTVPTFAIVQRHTDIGVDYVYRGCRITNVALAAPLGANAGVTFGVVGEDAEVYTMPGDAVFTAATGSLPFVTTSGSFDEGGLAIAYATDYNLTLDNNIAPLFSLFQRPAYSVQNGVFTASGTMTAYLPDGTLFNKFLNESSTTHVVTLTEGAASYTFTLPSVKYTAADKQTQGDGAIQPSYTFSAGYDLTTDTTVTIERT